MYSKEHQNYLRNTKKRNLSIRILQLLIITAFIVIWQVLADKHIINTFITSSPKDVVNTIMNLNHDGSLWVHIGVTLYETLLSFLLGMVIGVLLATLFWWSDFTAKVMDPYLTIINSLPKVALGPIIIIWAGASINSIIIMALMISVIITIINVYDGFKSTDFHKIRLLKSFGATKKQIFFKAILPSNFLIIISSLKICISMSLIGVNNIVRERLVKKN